MNFDDESSESSEWIYVNNQSPSNGKHRYSADTVQLQKSDEIVVLKEHLRLTPEKQRKYDSHEVTRFTSMPRIPDRNRLKPKRIQSCIGITLDSMHMDSSSSILSSTDNTSNFAFSSTVFSAPTYLNPEEVDFVASEENANGMQMDPVINFQAIAGKDHKAVMANQKIPEHLKTPSITFKVHRLHTFGKKVAFQLFKKHEIVYTSKFKHSAFYLQKTDNSLLKPVCDGILAISGFTTKTCNLYQGNDQLDAYRIASAKVCSGKKKCPRDITFTFENRTPEKYVKTLTSRKPTYNEDKREWELDFYGRYVVKSIKNAILEANGLKRAILIRKISKDELEIETLHELDPMYIMALGIISFVC